MKKDCFTLPAYHAPDFAALRLADAPDACFARCETDGVAPDGFHSTSMYPEYVKCEGVWMLAGKSRMDCTVVRRPDGSLAVVEPRNLRAGDAVLLGRSDDGMAGVYLHTAGFSHEASGCGDAFAFRTGRSRETAFSRDYDELYTLLRYERAHGNILFVLGPACAFDADSRVAMQHLIEQGFVHGLLAGNALATHDLEAGYLHTALGQDIYTQQSTPNGHYHHLDVLNRVRRAGSIPQFLRETEASDGILYALTEKKVPYVLTSSIRDDGPLPEVIADAYAGQSAMRRLVEQATTVICLATQLHTIATGNMTPSFCIREGVVRPVYFYAVDISEFVVNKLRDRGSLSAKAIVTNVQDFVVQLAKNLTT